MISSRASPSRYTDLTERRVASLQAASRPSRHLPSPPSSSSAEPYHASRALRYGLASVINPSLFRGKVQQVSAHALLPGLPRDCSGRCCSILGVAPRSSQQQGRLKMETRDSSHLHSRGRHGGMHGGGGGAFVARRENKVKTEMQLRSQAACFELSD